MTTLTQLHAFFWHSPVLYPQYTQIKAHDLNLYEGVGRDGIGTQSVQGCPLAYNTDP